MCIREVGRDREYAGRGGKLGCDALEDLFIAALRVKRRGACGSA